MEPTENTQIEETGSSVNRIARDASPGPSRRPGPRRSLLRERVPTRSVRLSVWRSLGVAYAAVLGLSAVWAFITERQLTVDRLQSIALMTLTFTTTITVLAHYSVVLVQRLFGTSRRLVRTLWQVLAWMVAGSLGSMAGVWALDLLGVPIAGGRSVTTVALLTNGAIAIVIGSVVLLLESSARRRRAERVPTQEEQLAAEFAAAQELQRSLMPDEDLTLHGFDISSATAPAVEIGGDYYDYLSFADGSKAILVADAAGKGIPAALMMAKFQGMAQALSIHVSDPIEFFVGLNDTMRVRMDRRNFVTVGMLTIDFDDNLAFYRAGHNPLLIYRARTRSVTSCRPSGLGLGLAHGATLSDSLEPYRFTMARGDVVLLYSDGITEAVNTGGEEFGEERLQRSLRLASNFNQSAAVIRRAILQDLSSFVRTAAPHDDMTVVVVRRE